MSGAYRLSGLKLVSDLPLPELLPWDDDDRVADVEVRLGQVPDAPSDLIHDGPLLKIAADGRCRFEIANVAAYWIEGGARITVDPRMAADAPDIRLFLLGTVFGFLCHQRGLIPLHAGCVEVDGRAVAFTGMSGAGKSTLAAAFLRRGFRILADDILVVELDGNATLARAAFPRIKLWQDALDGLDLAPDGLERVRSELDKFQLPVADRFQPGPLPLAALYHLHKVNDDRLAGIAPLKGAAAVDAAFQAIYRKEAAVRMGRRTALLSASMRMAALPARTLARSGSLDRLDAMVNSILADLASA